MKLKVISTDITHTDAKSIERIQLHIQKYCFRKCIYVCMYVCLYKLYPETVKVESSALTHTYILACKHI